MGGPPLIVIPAKASSERIPNKNYVPLHGIMPVQRALNVACALPEPAVVIVTANRLSPHGMIGNHTWVLSSTHYAERMADVVADVLDRVAGPPEQSVLLLQPTQPLRRIAHLIDALTLLEQHPSVVSVVEARPAQKCYYRFEDETLTTATFVEQTERDQDCRLTYTLDGTVYGFQRGWFLDHRQFVWTTITRSIIISPAETCFLDTPHDWAMAELRLRALEGSHG